jgi:hypothetical protein
MLGGARHFCPILPRGKKGQKGFVHFDFAKFDTLIRTTKRLIKCGHKVVLQFDTNEECNQAVGMLLAQSMSCRTVTREYRGDESAVRWSLAPSFLRIKRL